MSKSVLLTNISRQQTPNRARCEAMGFLLESSEVRWTGDALQLHGRFKCVCGRYENFNFRIEIDPAALDPARLLREYGAFSHEHLEQDGYTPVEINNILSLGEAYDLANS